MDEIQNNSQQAVEGETSKTDPGTVLKNMEEPDSSSTAVPQKSDEAILEAGQDSANQEGAASPEGATSQGATSQPTTANQQEERVDPTNLIVNYLPRDMSEQNIRELFGGVGEIDSCRLVMEKLPNGQPGTLSMGYAFVTYTNVEDAEKAIAEHDGRCIRGKIIRVSHARPSSDLIKNANVYVSGFPKSWTKLELENVFAPYGKIISARILTDKNTGFSKGVGFVRFDKREEAERAISSLHTTIPPGSSEFIIVKPARTHSDINASSRATNDLASAHAASYLWLCNNHPYHAGPMYPPMGGTSSAYSRYSPYGMGATNYGRPYVTGQSTTSAGGYRYFSASMDSNSLLRNHTALSSNGWVIFVHNLAPGVTEDTIWGLFCVFGPIRKVNIVRDQVTGRSKGYGFVTMPQYEHAYNAISMLNGTLLEGRTLTVAFKSPKDSHRGQEQQNLTGITPS